MAEETWEFKDRKAAEKPYGRITVEQYQHLTPMGKELHDYWRKFKKKMYKEMADEGTLLPMLISEGERLSDLVTELTPQIGLAGAEEMARSEIYDEMSG